MSEPVSARERILSAIRNARAESADATSIDRHTIARPAVPPKDMDSVIERFMRYACEESATAARVADPAGVPGAVFRYLHGEGLDPRVIVAGNAGARDFAWESATDLDRVDGPVGADGDSVVSGCYAGVAEAGAVVTLSAGDHPSEFNFLAATHIVVIPANNIVATFEDLWSRLRSDHGDGWPRMMNFIVGPSRTADLGVPSRLGAHGPSRVHIIVVGR